MRNSTRTTLASIALAPLALTACAPAEAPEPPAAVEQTAPPEQTTPVPHGDPVAPQEAEPEAEARIEWDIDATDRAYLDDVRSTSTAAHTETDDDLIAGAFLVCLVYEINTDAGITFDETRAEILADPDPLLAEVDRAAREHYCPQDGAK